MVFNATFNNISAISWQYVLLVEETGVPRENQTCRKQLTNFIPKSCFEYTSQYAGFELTSLMMLGTDWLTNSHIAMKLLSPIFIPCRKPRYNCKLTYRHPPRRQKIKCSIYCWLSLNIMPISYVTRRWFYRRLLFLQVKSWNHSVSFRIYDWTLLIVNKMCLKF